MSLLPFLSSLFIHGVFLCLRRHVLFFDNGFFPSSFINLCQYTIRIKTNLIQHNAVCCYNLCSPDIQPIWVWLLGHSEVLRNYEVSPAFHSKFGHIRAWQNNGCCFKVRSQPAYLLEWKTFRHVADVMKDAHRSPFRYGKRTGKESLDSITFELARAALNPKEFAPLSENRELDLETEKQSILDLLPEIRSHLTFVKLLTYRIIEYDMLTFVWKKYVPCCRNKYKSMSRTSEQEQPVSPIPQTLEVSELLKTRDTGEKSLETWVDSQLLIRMPLFSQKPLQHYRRMNFTRARPGKRNTSISLFPFGTRQKNSLRYSPG